MYILNYEISLIWILLLANIGVILALILVILELRQLRKLRKSFEHLFGKHEDILEKDEKIFWKELSELKNILRLKKITHKQTEDLP